MYLLLTHAATHGQDIAVSFLRYPNLIRGHYTYHIQFMLLVGSTSTKIVALFLVPDIAIYHSYDFQNKILNSGMSHIYNFLSYLKNYKYRV
jgi:hypothetical protein